MIEELPHHPGACQSQESLILVSLKYLVVQKACRVSFASIGSIQTLVQLVILLRSQNVLLMNAYEPQNDFTLSIHF